jgi:sialidase-1
MNTKQLPVQNRSSWFAAKHWSTVLVIGTAMITGCVQPQQSVRGPTSSEHADVNVFLGESRFDDQTIFSGERFPNVVVTTDGTVLAIWGGIARDNRGRVRVRRSEDGGATWGPEITVANPGFHGGGAIVDERSGDVLVFAEAGHPPSPLSIYRSKDQGKTWALQPTVIQADEKGQIPSMHMNERGITLRKGPHAGRLLRPSRSYGAGNGREYWNTHYTNALYSDDGGITWKTSRPFPALGTGEATLAELTDGRIYYNSRRHLSTDGRDPRRRHIAWSDDGGHSWKDLSVSAELPDGEQDRDYGLMAGLVRLPVANRDILIFSNIESDNGRQRGTVWASFDGGVTWPIKRLAQEGGFAYSSLAVGTPGTAGDGWIYLLYEQPGESGTTGKMIRFNLTWLLHGKDISAYLAR